MTGVNSTRSHDRQRGQALIELALAMPALLLVLLGIVVFGRVLEARSAVEAAAREAARVYAESSAQRPGLTLAISRARDVAQGYDLAPERLGITIDGGGFARGGEVTVQTSYAVPVFDVPYARQFTGPAITVRATHREVIEGYRSRQRQ